MKVLMKAKAVAILTAFLMVFAMMPLVAFGEETPEGETPEGEILAEDPVSVDTESTDEEQYLSAKDEDSAVVEYGLWVGGEQVTSEKLSGEGNVGNKGTWTFDPDTYTLALDNYNYNGAGYCRGTGYPSAGIYSYDDDISLTITLKGNNTITSSSGNGYPHGILCFGPLIIEDDTDSGGIGQLNVHAEGNGSNEQSYGIYTEGDFTINGGIVNDVAYASRYYSYAVIVYDGDVIINGGSLIGSGDTVIKSDGESCGIYLADEGHKVLVDSDAAVVTAAGYTSAIHGIVNNILPAKGWADVAGTGEGASIGTYSGTEAGYDFNNPPYNGYKKVQFEKSEYNLWVGGTQVTSSNRNNIPATNGTKTGKASFDPKTYTLTLDNYTYTGAGFWTSGIFSNDENSDIKLTILLKGINTITASKDSYTDKELHECQGIRVDRPLEIKGSNTDQLNLHAEGVTNNNKHARGLYVVRGDLTISGGIVNAVAYACEYYSGGIYVENGNAYINGGTVIGKGDGVAGESIGIETKRTKELCIGKDVQAVTAIGATRAMGGMVKNETPGKGWTNVDGTGEAAPIEKYSGTGDGYIFNDVPYSTYKKVLFEPVHEHSFTYAAGTGDNANKITATCEGNLDCPEGYKTNGITITLNEPASLDYDGTAKAATIDDSGYPQTAVAGLDPKPSVIAYYKSEGPGSTTVSGEPLSGAPAGAGDYVAQMTWGDATTSATASVPFSIAKAPLTITALDQTYEYNGQEQGVGDTVYESDFDKYVTCEGLKGGDTLTSIELFSQAKDIGVYEGEKGVTVRAATVNDLSEEDGNYAITYVPGKLTIKSKDASKASGTPVTKMTSGKTSMTLAWEKTEGVDGYDIFFSRCNHGSKKVALKNVKTISGNNTFVWKNSSLKKGTCYKAYVKAYIMTSSGKKYVKSSPLMHAYTGKGTKKYTNAKSVKVNKKNVSVKVGRTFKLKAKVRKLKKNKKLMPKSHVATVRYLSTDTSIATVNSKGKIKGIKKGTCFVYAYAHNGVFKKVTVTVK